MEEGKCLFVSVIIPVYNDEKNIAICLSSINNSEYSNFEVIIVDDNSNDRTLSIIEDFPCKTIKLEENSGQARARNIGAKASHGEILIFFDSDIAIEKDTLAQMVESLQNRPDTSALFGSFQKNTISDSFFTVYKNLRHHFTHQNSRNNASTFCGRFGAVRRDVFFEIGGFNEDYRVLEDIELGYRLCKSNHKIYLDSSIPVTHYKNYTFESLIKSDFMDRAIPWTKLILTNKVFKNDLNTRTNHVISVLISFIIFFNVLLIYIFPKITYVFIPLFATFLFLNRRFYLYILNKTNVIFTVKSILLNWFSYFYSSIGLVIALLSFSMVKPILMYWFSYFYSSIGSVIALLSFSTVKPILMNWFSSFCSGIGLVIALIGFSKDNDNLKVKMPITRYYNDPTYNDRWIAEAVFVGKQDGYFVEVGACSGIGSSSCYVLEKNLGWSGICVEPNEKLFEQLVMNRPNSICENVCLSNKNGEVTYVQGYIENLNEKGEVPYIQGEPTCMHPMMGGIKENILRYRQNDAAATVHIGEHVTRAATTLFSLLQRNNAPEVIDYLSLDIEGSELPVLEVFLFGLYTILAISIEGVDCNSLLLSKGYIEVKNSFNLDAPYETYFVHPIIVEQICQ
jgi:methyltransferase, FkbM family